MENNNMKFKSTGTVLITREGMGLGLANICRDVGDVYNAIEEATNVETLTTNLKAAIYSWKNIVLERELNNRVRYKITDHLGNVNYFTVFKEV